MAQVSAGKDVLRGRNVFRPSTDHPTTLTELAEEAVALEIGDPDPVHASQDCHRSECDEGGLLGGTPGVSTWSDREGGSLRKLCPAVLYLARPVCGVEWA